MSWDEIAAVLIAAGPPAKGEALKLFVGALRAVVGEPPDVVSGRGLLEWCARSNPVAGLLVDDLSEEQEATVVLVLDGMLRERSGAAANRVSSVGYRMDRLSS